MENTDLRMKIWGLPIFDFRSMVAKADDQTFEAMTADVYTVWERTVLQGIAVLMTAICDRKMEVPLHEAVRAAAFKAGVREDKVWRLLTPEYFGVYVDNYRERTLQGALERARKLLIACDKEGLIALYESTVGEIENVTARKALIREREQRERAKMPRIQPRHAQQPTDDSVLTPNTSRWVIPDAPGQDLKPDPVDVTTVKQLIAQLRELHAWLGYTSLRELSRRINGEVAHSTFSVMLNERNPQFPSQRTLVSFVRALGCDEDEVSRWVSAWRRVRNNPRRRV